MIASFAFESELPLLLFFWKTPAFDLTLGAGETTIESTIDSRVINRPTSDRIITRDGPVRLEVGRGRAGSFR